MSRSKWMKAAFGLIGLAAIGGLGGKARAQAIGFQPIITPVPSGASLTVTPVVSADRRYVRLGLTPVFTSLRGVDTFSFGAGAVAGGGGFGGFGGGGGGGFGNGGAGNGGLASFAPQADPNNPAIVPAAFRQIAPAGNVGNNGAAVIPGLGAVGSGWGFPNYGLPAYGYGYNAGFPGYGYGYPGYGYPAGYPFNNSYFSYGYYDVTNGGYYAPFYGPPQTVNAMGDVMGAIIQSAGGRR